MPVLVSNHGRSLPGTMAFRISMPLTMHSGMQATLLCTEVPSSACRASHQMGHQSSSPIGKTVPLPGASTTERAAPTLCIPLRFVIFTCLPVMSVPVRAASQN